MGNNTENYIGMITLALAIMSSLIYSITKFIRIEFKVNLLWEYIMKKALTGVISNEFGQLNSPFIINENIEKLFDRMKDNLKQFYVENKNMTEVQLFMAFGQKFGERIMREIAVPNKMVYDECIILALNVAKKNSLTDRNSTAI